jgi:L-asparaginase/Glu-tRNA(Gln) amidotransferase subunit D
MYDLVRRIDEFDADPDIEGIVIRQGTNTLETVSYFIDLCYASETPVVFADAMRNPSLASHSLLPRRSIPTRRR